MTLEDRQQAEIDRLDRVKDGRREAVVTAVSPLEISIGGSDTSVRAVAADGVELQVNDRVTVSIQDMAIPFVLGRPTDDPQNAAGGGPPTGSAGGDLSGTYPNPQIASGAIVNADVSASAAIAQSKVSGLTTDLAAKAPLASPTFTGDPKAPTPATSDNDTSIATTAHVKAQPLNAFAAPTADIPMSTQKFTGMAQGSASGHSVEYDQMIAGDVAAQLGFTMKPAVYAASIAALPAHGRSGDVLTASGNGFLAPSFGTLKFSWATGSAGTGNGQFDEPYDVALDSGGNIFVLDRGNSRVQKFNSSGVYQSQFSVGGRGDGIAIDSSDRIYIASGTSIDRYSAAGSYQTSFPMESAFITVGGIAIDGSGNIYVAVVFSFGDTFQVHKFNSSGTYQSAFGSTGSGNGQFNNPRAIACDSSNNVYVADSGNHRVQKFNSSGTYQSQFGTVGKEDGQFLAPNGIEIDSGGNIWVADHFNNRVQKFNSSGTFQAKYGSLGSGNGQLLGPRGLVVTSGGDLIVADSYNNRIQRFTAFTLTAGQTVLVRHEGGGTHIENNIYEVTNPGGASAQWVLTLRSDGATGFLKAQNMVIAQVENATQNRVFTLTTSDPITVWTTPLTWERFEPGGPPSPHASNHSPGSSDPIPELEDLMPLLDEEPWTEIGSGGSAPAFQNSWVNDGGAGLETAGFYKDPFGIVHLKGRVKSGTVTATIFTLPPGYRPAATSDHAVVSLSAFGRVIVATNGNVTLTVGSNTWASLSGISFKAA